MKQTDDTTEPGTYPIQVFDVDKIGIGLAYNKDEYISIWNALPKHSPIGFLTGASGPFVFQYHKNIGPVPNFVYGNHIDGVNQYPVITLLGANPFIMYVGDAYVEPGYTAIDSEDGNITSNVVKVTSLNNTAVGSGQVSYNVTDAGGLPATQRVRALSVIDIPCPVFTAAQTGAGQVTVTFVRDAIANGGYSVSVYDSANSLMGSQAVSLVGTSIGDTINVVLDTADGFTFSSAGTYRFLLFQSRASGYQSSGSCAKQSVTMSASGVAPTITVQPTNQNITEGATLTLSVTATGTAPLSYQWRKDGANISGATSSTYTKTSILGDAGSYTVIVTNAYGSVTSNAATVTVNAASSNLTATLKYKGTHTPGDYTGATTLRSATYPTGGTLVISFAGLPDEQFWWIEYPATDTDFVINNTGGLNTDSPIPDANFDKATAGGVKRVFTKGLLSVQSTNDLTLKH